MSPRFATAGDAEAIARIYAPFVEGSAVSFERHAPDADAMRDRILAGGDLYPWLVAEDAGRVTGYAYATAFRARHAYRFTVETSVYLDPAAHGRGVATALYARLLDLLTRQGFVQAIAAVTEPNAASAALHAKCGFERVGCYRDVGHKLGQWRSVSLWQRGLAPMADVPAEPVPFAQVQAR